MVIVNGKEYANRWAVLHKGTLLKMASIAANSKDEAEALLPHVAEFHDVAVYDLMVGEVVE